MKWFAFALSIPALAVTITVASPAPVAAQATLLDGFGGTASFGTSCLGKSDDGSSPSIDLNPYFPDGLQFFDALHRSVFVNVNGNVTFGAAQACYTPMPFPIADQPMIAPYWGDVDIRPFLSTSALGRRNCDGPEGTTTCVTQTVATCHNPADNGVWYHLEPGRMIVTWHRVGYYQCRNNRRMSFQLVLTAAPGCGGAGDFDVEFRYAECGWTTGDASGGSNGFGGTEAQAGFDAGNLSDFVEIMGSRTDTVHTILCTMSNVGEPGVWRFQIRSGAVVCPDAGMPCDTGGVGVCGSGRTQCVGGGTECRPEVTAGDERCDALDNDCDGTTDEGDALCGPLAVCERGTCVAGCFEGGCAEGQLCSAAGFCVDAACVDIDCPEGQRCVGGACVGACDGVVCPAGLACRGGRCVDPCMGAICDDCTTCADGSCAPRCEFAGCPSGQTCQADGTCLDDGCVGMSCGAGEVCVGGSCVDACAGAMCPAGETCALGECVPRAAPDAGVPPPADGGGVTPPIDAGGVGALDAGALDGGADGGRRVPPGGGPGCACRVRPVTGGQGGLALAMLLGLAWRGRLRRGR